MSFLSEVLERHLDHADRALHDFASGGDDGFGLLAAEHGLGDLRRVGEVGEAGLLDPHSGLGEPRRDSVRRPSATSSALSRSVGSSSVSANSLRIIGVGARHVAGGRLALGRHVPLEIIDVEGRLRGIFDPPHDDRGDFHRVAALVVHPEFFAVKVAGAETQLVALEFCGPAWTLLSPESLLSRTAAQGNAARGSAA